ncbi:ORC-CDC6 family AAA ATPase [Noviherbaspirillum pedocola]|uniref:Uncharacterized protein n=1 Tax=Noviherbaspirillum pedocola TaxID=2801341 RepID=A0A934SXA1_9BURK|nr:hypothetical protein [Noviherbaspirillum pedocola]MBK4737359.1 hypothetical protein [Noviherbaspirillum pedocola]
MKTYERAFARNRAEEMGPDLWNDFIIPPYFDKLHIMYVRKPYVIVGGRGCGKTTLLRYWSYNTQFSAKRKDIPDEAFSTIGLYIRTDIQFLSSFQGAGIEAHVWNNAFEHALCLAVADEVLGCLAQINCTPLRNSQYGDLNQLDFSELSDFDDTIPGSYQELKRFISRSRMRLASWINNLDLASERPRFYPLRPFIGVMIKAIQTLSYLTDTVFAVFVDEYESLLEYQQIFVNTLLKLSQPPLVFHVAMKRNGMPFRATTAGNEMIQDEADFRTFDIEKEQGDDFRTFAAELFFFRLMAQEVILEDDPVDLNTLTNPDRLAVRRNDVNYQGKLKAAIEKILPSVSPAQVALMALSDEVLRSRLMQTIENGLLRRNPGKLKAEDFVDDKFPEASVVNGALLHQRKSPEDVHASFIKYKKRQDKNSPHSEWIHHFLHGTLFYLYQPLNRPCLLYSGFDTFILLSLGNTRHFLELCHLAIGRSNKSANESTSSYELVVPVHDQAEAARDCSGRFLEEVKGSGTQGKQLYHIANTLGQIFKLAQQRPAQSEPEKTHFAVANGQLSDDAITLLNEAEKWGVLIGQTETKVKTSKFESKEYTLNPIFAPSFGISYRRGRKLDLPGRVADRLLLASNEGSTAIIKEFERGWNKDAGDQLSLIDDSDIQS